MKVVILAGGYGTRLSEETDVRPKPMVEIGGRPILWHIMSIYSAYGHTEFVILLGYKGYVIKEYFANYFLHHSDVTIDLSSGSMDFHSGSTLPWRITLLDTGAKTMTGGRIRRAKELIGNEAFMLTYGDGVCDINMSEQLSVHRATGSTITMTAVQPDGRFGTFESDESGQVKRFLEKPKGDGSWINGGFFICEPEVFDYIPDDDAAVFEQEPLQNLASDGKMYCFEHHGFWKCMDTLKDKNDLNNLWDLGSAPWRVWQDV